MSTLKVLRDYFFFYSGIEKEEYEAVKKDAYVSNYHVWRILHVVMAAAFAFLYISSLFNAIIEPNPRDKDRYENVRNKE